MTHLEWFRYPVWDVERAKKFEKLPTEAKVLIDYQIRSPLTREAAVVVLEEGV